MQDSCHHARLVPVAWVLHGLEFMNIETLTQQIEEELDASNVIDFETLLDEMNEIGPMKRNTLTQKVKRAIQTGDAIAVNVTRYIDSDTAERWKSKHRRKSF